MSQIKCLLLLSLILYSKGTFALPANTETEDSQKEEDSVGMSNYDEELSSDESYDQEEPNGEEEVNSDNLELDEETENKQEEQTQTDSTDDKSGETTQDIAQEDEVEDVIDTLTTQSSIESSIGTEKEQTSVGQELETSGAENKETALLSETVTEQPESSTESQKIAVRTTQPHGGRSTQEKLLSGEKETTVVEEIMTDAPELKVEVVPVTNEITTDGVKYTTQKVTVKPEVEPKVFNEARESKQHPIPTETGGVTEAPVSTEGKTPEVLMETVPSEPSEERAVGTTSDQQEVSTTQVSDSQQATEDSRNGEDTQDETDVPAMKLFSFDLPIFNETLHRELLMNESEWAKELAAAAHPDEDNTIHDPCTFISENIHNVVGLNVTKEQIHNTLPTFRFLLNANTEELTTIKDMLLTCVEASDKNQETSDPGCLQIRNLIAKTCQEIDQCRGKEDYVMTRAMSRIREVIDTDQLADALLMIRACAGQSYE